MANVNLLMPAFGIKWAQDGTVAVIDEAQWRAGWAFIGATPPTVEQFNKVMQVGDEKANYLYAQMLSVFTAGGQVPAAGTVTTLRDAISGMVNLGRLVGLQVLSASGTYTRTAGATRGRLRMWGGGAGGGSCGTTTAGQASIGAGGGSGAYLEHYFTGGTLPASQAFTIGAGGAAGIAGGGGAGGGAGGATIFGSLNAPGAPASPGPVTGTPSILLLSGFGAAQASGGNILNSPGQAGYSAHAFSASFFFAGGGAPSTTGGGANCPPANVTSPGVNTTGVGAGGSGGQAGPSSASQPGGLGGRGQIIIEEYA